MPWSIVLRCGVLDVGCRIEAIMSNMFGVKGGVFIKSKCLEVHLMIVPSLFR